MGFLMLGGARGAELHALQHRMRATIERLRTGGQLDATGVHVCRSNVRLLVDPQVLALFRQPTACPVGAYVVQA